MAEAEANTISWKARSSESGKSGKAGTVGKCGRSDKAGKGRTRNRILAALYGLCFAAACLVGGMLEKNGCLGRPSAKDLLPAAGAGLLSAAACLLFWRWEDERSEEALEEAAVSKVSDEQKGASSSAASHSCRDALVHAASRTADLHSAARCLAAWGLLMAVDLVSLLAVYPGFFVYDAAEELAMVQSRSFTAHHPLLHVLLLGGTILAAHKVTGSYNAGMFLWSVLQMAVINAVFVFVLRELKKRSCRKGFRIFSLLWYALCPVITMFVLCSCKDGLFSAALLMMTVLLRRILTGETGETKREKKFTFTGFVLSGTLMMLLRNNGVYAYAVFLAVLFAGKGILRRQRGECRNLPPKREKAEEKETGETGARLWRKAAERTSGRRILGQAVLFLLPLFLYAGSSQLLVRATGAATGESQEILTVPIMQLARVWNASPEDFTEEEMQTMEAFMEPSDGWEAYNPVLSDQVKLHFNNEYYRDNKSDFWKLWLAKGREHPAAYLNAWLMTSYGFWTPGAVIDCYKGNTVYTFTYGDSSYFGYETELPGVRTSKIPVLDAWYRFLSLDVRAQKLPLPGILLSCGVMAWIFFFALTDLFRKRAFGELASLLPVLLVWMTVLLGPCTLPRYVVYLWFGLPCFLSGCFAGRNPENK